jgi:formylglycine-generating enzyme
MGWRARAQNVVQALSLCLLLTGAVVAVKPLPVTGGRLITSTGPPTGPDEQAPAVRATQPRAADLVMIPAGTAHIGDIAGPADERPEFRYSSGPFLMDRTPVTVAQFAAFVKDTGYTTDAVRYGAGGVLDERQGAWVAVPGADWRYPQGKGRPAAPVDHPVTQVSWYDASTFCRAYRARLPTEFEWERAARMGQTPDGHVFKAGDPIELSGRYRLNAWQGVFPLLNTAADGYRTTSPVGAFGAAPSGLTDMAGNVWEWTSSGYLPYSAHQHDPVDIGGAVDGERVSRGGSFLCSPGFCEGYRASARNHTTPDTSLENIGFRCVADPEHISDLAGRVVLHPQQLAETTPTRTDRHGAAQ